MTEQKITITWKVSFEEIGWFTSGKMRFIALPAKLKARVGDKIQFLGCAVGDPRVEPLLAEVTQVDGYDDGHEWIGRDWNLVTFRVIHTTTIYDRIRELTEKAVEPILPLDRIERTAIANAICREIIPVADEIVFATARYEMLLRYFFLVKRANAAWEAYRSYPPSSMPEEVEAAERAWLDANVEANDYLHECLRTIGEERA